MARIGLSLYLMLAAAAGPLFCCCTSERLLAALFAPPTQQASHAGCCADHQASKGSQKHRTSEQRPGDQDQPGHPSCPCQEDGSQQVTLAPLDSEAAKQLQSRYSFQGFVELMPLGPMASYLSAEGDPQTSEEGVCLPFLSAQDILRALHILRC
jgi:hypothetical protein